MEFIHFPNGLILLFLQLKKKYRFIQMKQQNQLKLTEKPIKQTKLYSLHQATLGEDKLYAKFFYNQAIEELDIEEALQYNEQVLMAQDFEYPQHFLFIQKTYPHNTGTVCLTQRYSENLKQYIQRKVALTEKQALEIFSQVIKVVYSLYKKGYWHRSLRAEHFVKVGNIWKLQSLVYTEGLVEKGENSQYIWSPAHQPPEAYGKQTFEQEELDQKIVWDLGALLIHMLLGNHKLKSMNILNKWKDSAFSFEKLGAQAAKKFSEALKQYLGQMCHYDVNKRMKVQELLEIQFFSGEIASKFQISKERQSRIFQGGSGSISKSLAGKNTIRDKSVNETIKIITQGHKEQQSISVQQLQKASSNLQDEDNFKNKLSGIYISKIHMGEKMKKKLRDNNTIVNKYKRYIDKCKMLTICGQKLQKMSDLFNNKQKAQQLVLLTKFAVNFVSTLDLYMLAKYMNGNHDYFDCLSEEYEEFQESEEYTSLKSLLNFQRDKGLTKINELKHQIKHWPKPNMATQEGLIKTFVERKVQHTVFFDVKYSYRRILKIAYDLVTDHYAENRVKQWAKIGMYLTFCMAIDKLYIPDEFEDNFHHYFEYEKIQKSEYIPLDKFQSYLESASKETLIKNSRFIIQKYFEI